MKKINIAILLSALIISGCQLGSNESSSSTNADSSTTIETIDWIKNGGMSDALNNPNEWLYQATANVKSAEYLEDTLLLEYSDVSSWDSVKLFYHDSSLSVGRGYTVSFDITTNKNGKITVNGQSVDVKDGTISVKVESLLNENTSSLKIEFGTESNGSLVENGKVMISKLTFSPKLTAKEIIESALETNNYTLALTKGMNGYVGEFKYFENAAYLSWSNEIDDTHSERGFAENDEGIFSFTKKTNEDETYIEAGSSYYLSGEDKVKGLYTNKDYVFTYEGYNGLPSLHSLDLTQFDFELEVDIPRKLEKGASLKALTYLLDDQYSTYYYAGVTEATVTMNSNGGLTFVLKNKMRDSSTFVLSNINNTKDELIETFVKSDNFGPVIKNDGEVNTELQSMFNDLNGANYLVNKADGSLFCINEKYIYNETIDPETNEKVITGYVKLNDGIYYYYVENGQVVLDEIPTSYTTISEIDGLQNNSYFTNTSLYVKNGNEYVMNLENDYSYYGFAQKWLSGDVVEISQITLERGISNITIGANVSTFDATTEETSIDWQYLVVYQINNATVSLLENYLSNN